MVDCIRPGFRRFFLYCLCGGGGVALDFSLYVLLLHFDVWYQFANVAGYTSGTLLSFVLNRIITFGVLDAPVRRLAMFFGVAAIGYGASSVSLFGLVALLHTDPVVAKVIVLLIVIAIQYTLNSLMTFRQLKPIEEDIR
jgi:putative flippase GtrA